MKKVSVFITSAVILCLIALLGIGTPVEAANGMITGTVTDIVTGKPVSGVNISDGVLSTTTNSAGSYTLNEAAGNYTLHTTASGYLTTYQVAPVASGLSTTINWALTKSYGAQAIPAKNMSYIILAWNDLGMHCDQNDYSYFMVLPPYNTLRAQVFQRGSEGANIVTSGITVSYAFPKKTNSTLHTNFWTYASKYGFNAAPNVGISGTPLAGNMTLDSKGLGWQAVGIPITPYDDDGTWDPYGTAVITVKNSSGQVLQTATVVAPVSTEMMCSNCHGTTNPQLNILQAHDAYNGTNLTADQAKGIVHSCSQCHSDNALGAPGQPGVESLSLAMHNFHKDKMNTTAASSATSPGCYNCHPGPNTQCLRGIMARAGKTCEDCHGDMNEMTTDLVNGRRPWIDEPDCGQCHGASYSANANTLFRNSVLQNSVAGDMNNKLYCEACHNSTHGEFISANSADPTIPQQLQGDNYWIWNCTVCHNATQQNMHRQISGGTTSTTYTLTASAGTGGSISPSGAVSVTSGNSRTFTITAASGYHIANVLVDGASVGTLGSYTFSSVTANHTISASFAVNTTTTYIITAATGAGGSVSPLGNVSVASGGSQTFTITATTGYHIANVLVDGTSVGAVGSYTFSSVIANHTISASFAVNTAATYTITASAGTGGSISPSGSVSVTSGGSRTFTISAANGYHVYRVLVDGVSVGVVGSYTFSNVTKNHTISASFAVNTYTIIASAGTGGSISPSGSVSVTSSNSRTFTISAANGYHVYRVLVDGVSVGSVSSYTFSNVTKNHTISASFARTNSDN